MLEDSRKWFSHLLAISEAFLLAKSLLVVFLEIHEGIAFDSLLFTLHNLALSLLEFRLRSCFL